MQAFHLYNRVSGTVLGVYPGETLPDALENIAREAGYIDAAQMNDVVSGDGEPPVAPYALHVAFREYQAGSRGFVEYVQAQCGYQTDDAVIEHMARTVAQQHPDDTDRAEAFEMMWRKGA